MKDFFRSFKKDSLVILVDVGLLRSHQHLSFGMDLIPHLIGQAEFASINKQRTFKDFEEIVEVSTRKAVGKHKQSILKEKKRLQDLEKERKRIVAETIEATKNRKERRNALREAYKLHQLTQVLSKQILVAASRAEYTPAV